MRARYTPEQLAFLRKHLPEYEKRNTSFKRGEAKKYAHETAIEYIAEFGLPNELLGSEEAESRLKEQVYNWYKNTTKRTRRKAHDEFLSSFRFTPQAQFGVDVGSVSASVAGPSGEATSMDTSPDSAPTSPATAGAAVTPTGDPGGSEAPSPTAPNPVLKNLSEVFNSPETDDSAALCAQIRAHARARGGPTPLSGVIDALFEEIHTQTRARTAPDYITLDPGSEPCYVLLRRFRVACARFPVNVMHAGIAGAAAGTKALEMKLRKAAVWMPTVSVVATAAPNGVKKEASGTMADELARINTDRKRRGAFMMDAFAHAAAVELGMLTREGRWYAESVAREAMWEGDESEWLAGAIVLRGFIRCRPLENPKRAEYERWLRAYEARWREFRDEHRQAMMAEVIMGAKQDILAL